MKRAMVRLLAAVAFLIASILFVIGDSPWLAVLFATLFGVKLAESARNHHP